MKILNLIEEDFCNYKKPSMFIAFPYCDFKCGRELCQNNALEHEPIIEVGVKTIVSRYLNNPITKAIVCGGLEPFDSFEDMYELVKELRDYSDDDVVIYSGYNEDEIKDKTELLRNFSNIIVKFGRYVPNEKPHFDEVLGVSLVSGNQYAKKLS